MTSIAENDVSGFATKATSPLDKCSHSNRGTVCKAMEQIDLIHKPRRKSNGIIKTDCEARKSDDLLKCNFYADKSLEKAVIDIMELKAKDGKLYVSAISNYFDLMPLRLVWIVTCGLRFVVRWLKM